MQMWQPENKRKRDRPRKSCIEGVSKEIKDIEEGLWNDRTQ